VVADASGFCVFGVAICLPITAKDATELTNAHAP
jgi:hypothetical protein